MISIHSDVQVDIKPTQKQAGVQCNLFDPPLTGVADTSVQCNIIESPLFTSTQRSDYYSTSESEHSEASPITQTSAETYSPSKEHQSSLS